MKWKILIILLGIAGAVFVFANIDIIKTAEMNKKSEVELEMALETLTNAQKVHAAMLDVLDSTGRYVPDCYDWGKKPIAVLEANPRILKWEETLVLLEGELPSGKRVRILVSKKKLAAMESYHKKGAIDGDAIVWVQLEDGRWVGFGTA
jgi:hypothetical protein